MRIAIYIVGTIGIIIFSWFFSIKDKRYHGIARFFAFESIFVLLMFNIKGWFRDPFSLHQVVSWILLFGSVYPGIAGFLLLKRHGKSETSFENTTNLVSNGIYKYIRHPLYCSLFMLGTGIMMKNPASLQLIAGAVNVIAVFFTAYIEEGEMKRRFGEDYRNYLRTTKMFIPFVL